MIRRALRKHRRRLTLRILNVLLDKRHTQDLLLLRLSRSRPRALPRHADMQQRVVLLECLRLAGLIGVLRRRRMIN